MTNLDFRAEIFERWRALGALVLMEPKDSSGLLASAFFPSGQIEKVAADLLAAECFLEDISVFEAQEGLVVTYHFNTFAPGRAGRLAPRVLVSPRDPHLPSISSIYQGAMWHERESYDFFGLIFDGHPNLIPLLLSDWHEGPPPLKKSPEKLAPLAALNLCAKDEIVDPSSWVHQLTKPSENKAEERS